MSSYPGIIYSGDDFLLSNSGLVVTETTIVNSNPDLWQYVHPRGTVLTGFRTMIASRLAKNGRSWSKIFARRNSGTENNQWLILDYKRFKPGKSLDQVSGLLWILEQLPGKALNPDSPSLIHWFS